METATKGNINVSVENIFPLIKKFLYSDHEIFLRELVSNATDATTKLKHLSSIGKIKEEFENLNIEIKVDKKNRKIHVIDSGIGMTREEVEKYINEIAFSGAEEFIAAYNESDDQKSKAKGIIGHFGLGFYSSFLVADKVEIITQSYQKDYPTVHWTCEGSPAYDLVETTKRPRGTEVILHISEDSKEFLDDFKIEGLLNKYSKFVSTPIKFGTRTETLPLPKDAPKDAKPETKEVDKIINNTTPAWTKSPRSLKEEDYKSFYRELYPTQFEEPLFHIHLNVDHPFKLTGILYFPKLRNDLSVQKDKIQLYQNQVFVTDNVEGIVPEFLTLLRGVIDSPDIPLNVSRSYLQADGAVKKISGHITSKVAAKLQSLFKKDRKGFEEKWNGIKVIIEYGMLSDENFYKKAEKFALYPTVGDEFLTYNELEEKIKANQTDKDGKLVILYASDKEEQHIYIENAKAKGYQVLLFNSPIYGHLLQKIETNKDKVSFSRVDSDSLENLIKTDDKAISKLDDKQQEKLKEIVKSVIKEPYIVQLEALDSQELPFVITQPEFMRRWQEMQSVTGTGFGGGMPPSYNVIVNTNHDLVVQIFNTKHKAKKTRLINQAFDFSRLSQNLLKGKELTHFIKRSIQLIQSDNKPKVTKEKIDSNIKSAQTKQKKEVSNKKSN
ncbi:MAG: molecular chaperone HtpG [Flavobacteriaceae bacterium]|nr:molecular chaperone HtpG [Flavobacteriaceae bacterium]